MRSQKMIWVKLNIMSTNKLTKVPRNMFIEEIQKDVFGNNLKEKKSEYEQFFWTRNTVNKLMESLKYTFDRCCLTTPSLAHAWYEVGEHEVLLDIDRRFDYLPKFKYYDVCNPTAITIEGSDKFRIIILDPPYFVVPIEQFRVAVDKITNKDYSTKILLGFLKREEKRLMSAFDDYNLKPTRFPLEYASIKPSKWGNFCLYSNIDLPLVKRIVKKK